MLKTTFLVLSALSALVSADDFTYPDCEDKQVVVQLFEWSWDAIARECEDVLGPKGFCGVQISPPHEHIQGGEWWTRYQPVSYVLNSRNGNRDQFSDMVRRCYAVGVNIYADVVFNQMAGGSGTGVGGTTFDAGSKSYPGVPYSSFDFNNQNCEINYSDAWSVRECALAGMPDLNQGTDYVRDMISSYMNDLLSLGVMGFRVDAAKHMWPEDLVAIMEMLDNNQRGNRPLVYQEVIDYHTEPIKMDEYFGSGKVTEFNYGTYISNCIWNGRDYNCLGGLSSSGLINGLYALSFIDNHDNQRTGGVLTHNDGTGGYEYKLANAFHLGHDYGFKRVMSSYYFDYSDQPPPSSDPPSDCGGGWVCEHRWPTTLNMVQFANAVVGEPIANWDVQGDVLGFSRGGKGFVVIGEANGNSFYTGMPDGTYCDIISECAQSVTVSGGFGSFYKYGGSDPAVAICVGCS